MPRLRRGESWGESKGLSAEVGQSAAAGLLWLSEGEGDHCGNVAGGPLSITAQLDKVNLLLILLSLLDKLEFLLHHNNAGSGVYSTCSCCHIYMWLSRRL